MPYAAKQDLIDRFGEHELVMLTDLDEPRTDAIVDGRIDVALADASAEIDGYLAGVYRLPLANAPATLRRICVDLARYHLGSAPPDSTAAKRYDDARKFLQHVAEGRIKLGVDETGAEPASGDTVRIDSGSKHFGRETFGG